MKKYKAFLLFWIVCSSFTSFSQVIHLDSFPSFYQVEENDTLSLKFEYKPNTRFEIIQLNPLPKGDTVFNGDHFKYIPAHDDWKQFTLVVQGKTDSEKQIDTVFILPRPKTRPEFETIKRNQAFNSDISIYSQTPIQRESVTDKDFNGTIRKTKTITITGINLEFEKDHINKLYNSLEETIAHRNDIDTLNLYADTIIIRNKFWLPQTNVNIYARVLKFEDKGSDTSQIITTPLEFNDKTIVGIDGKKGYKAGDLFLNVKNIIAKDTLPRFILIGGRGQHGGSGKMGESGRSATPVPEDVIQRAKALQSLYQAHPLRGRLDPNSPDPQRDGLIFLWYKPKHAYDSETVSTGDLKDFRGKEPTNGWPGLPSGKPGVGGIGGNCFINDNIQLNNIPISISKLNDIIRIDGGMSGKIGDTARGGDAGTPSPYAIHRYDGNEYPNTCCNNDETGTTRKGADIAPLQPDSIKGLDGQIKTINQFFLHPLAAQKILHRAKDAYLNENFDLADRILTNLLIDFEELKNDNSTGWLALNNIKNEAVTLKQRLDSHLDYFGNPEGWVPLLSMEFTMDLFEKELQYAIPVWYLTDKLKKQDEINGKTYQSLTILNKKLYDDTEDARKNIIKLTNTMTDVGSDIDKVKELIKLIEQGIKYRSDYLKPEADAIVKKRHEKSFWEEALSTIASICTVLPIGQPVLGTVATAVKTVSNVSLRDPIKAFNRISGVYESFNKRDFDQSINSTKKFFSDFSPNNATGLNDYARKLQNVADQYNSAIDNFYNINSSQQNVPHDEIMQELERLKSSDTFFTKLVESVQLLMELKRNLSEQLTSLNQELKNTTQIISSNVLTRINIQTELDKKLGLFDPSLSSYIDDLKRQSEDRLLKYQYYMAKAYEYRLLSPYPGNLSLKNVFDKIRERLDTSETISQDNYNYASLIYKNELRKIIDNGIDELIKRQKVDKGGSDVLILTDKQLEELKTQNETSVPINQSVVFIPGQENRRLDDVEIIKESLRLKSDNINSFHIEISHEADSDISQNGVFYRFRNVGMRNPFSWGFDWEPGTISKNKISTKYLSLIRTLLGFKESDKNYNDLELFIISPGLDRSQLTIKLQKEGIEINSLALRLSYSYTPTKIDNAIVKRNEKILTVTTHPFIRTYYSISTEDKTGRKNGYTSFTRFYKSSQNSVTIEADSSVLGLKFKYWLVGQNQPKQEYRNPITFSLKNNIENRIVAVYEPIINE